MAKKTPVYDTDEATKEKKHPYLLVAIFLVITILLLSGSIVLYVGSKSYNDAMAAAAPFEAPASGLSQSLFVAQNSSYEENSSYPLEYNFGSVPYKCNAPRLTYIKLGNGIVMNNDSYWFYYLTEADNDKIEEAFIDELSYAVLATADVSKTEFVAAGTDRGFFNGFDVVYMAGRFTVSDENRTIETYTLSYIFPVENTGRSAVMTMLYPGKRTAENNMWRLQEWAKTFRVAASEDEGK